MIKGNYKVVFQGEFEEGYDVESVKHNLGRLFKLSEIELELFFSRQKITIKKGINKETAHKYQQLIKEAGGITIIEQMDDKPRLINDPKELNFVEKRKGERRKVSDRRKVYRGSSILPDRRNIYRRK